MDQLPSEVDWSKLTTPMAVVVNSPCEAQQALLDASCKATFWNALVLNVATTECADDLTTAMGLLESHSRVSSALPAWAAKLLVSPGGLVPASASALPSLVTTSTKSMLGSTAVTTLRASPAVTGAGASPAPAHPGPPPPSAPD